MTRLCHTQPLLDVLLPQGRGEEAVYPGGGGGTGGYRDGDHRLWDPPYHSILLQGTGEIYFGGGQRLASSDPKYLDFTAEVGGDD